MYNIDKIIDGASYLLDAQRSKLKEDLCDISSEGELIEFLGSALGIYESDLSAEDRRRINEFISRRQ